MSCEKAFLERLRERGFRLTPQREMVLSVMHGLEGFCTAEDIYGRVGEISSAVDISTVYRTLDLLQEFELVASVDRGEGQRVYQLVGVEGPHLHLVCRSCGEVTGAELEPAGPLAAFLEEQYGFETDLRHLSVPGLCRECRECCEAAGRA